MFGNKTIHEFLQDVSNKSPLVPTSGSVIALSAASAAALAGLVANVTLGKKGYENVQEEMKEILHKTLKLREQFVQAMDEDAYAFTLVLDALRLPKATEEEIVKRNQALQQSLERATRAPLKLAQGICSLMELIEALASRGNKNALGDTVTAANLSKAAIASCLYNAKENLKAISNPKIVQDILKDIAAIEAKLKEIERTVLL